MTARIRPAMPEDAPAMLEIYAPIVRETAISFELEVPSLAQFRARVEEGRAAAPWLVCEQEGRMAGYCYAGRFRPRPAYQWTAETTVYLHADFRGQGLGAAVYGKLLECLRLQGYQSAVGIIALPNPGSVRLHEALGFRPLGVLPRAGYKFNSWHEIGWWVLELGADAVPAPLRPIEEVWRAAGLAP